MAQIKARKTRPSELAWLIDVMESRQPLNHASPIWVREGFVTSGPPVPHPERHPYCEFNLILKGGGTAFVGNEEAARLPGDLLLLGPEVPHWGRIKTYPHRAITVYFLPAALVDIGPVNDGVRILRRFTASRSLRERLVRLPRQLRARFTAHLETMLDEFRGQRFGRDVRLRSLLLEQMVDLLRWEESRGIAVGGESSDVEWGPVIKALHYLREHHADPVYAQEVARAAGVSESRLKALFRQTLNLSWVKYLQGYRIHRAAALLGEGRLNVTQVALEVGFDSVSHFNQTFRAFMGMSPKSFARR